MRALGLPNTKHFHEITRIEDALARKQNSCNLLPMIVVDELCHQSPRSSSVRAGMRSSSRRLWKS